MKKKLFPRRIKIFGEVFVPLADALKALEKAKPVAAGKGR